MRSWHSMHSMRLAGSHCGKFCTWVLTLASATGVLLRRLLGDAELQGTTHVIVDEVHERSVDSDLLLLLLRDLLATGRAPGLRLVLMSATADADAFARYFDAALGKEAGFLKEPPRYGNLLMCENSASRNRCDARLQNGSNRTPILFCVRGGFCAL